VPNNRLFHEWAVVAETHVQQWRPANQATHLSDLKNPKSSHLTCPATSVCAEERTRRQTKQNANTTYSREQGGQTKTLYQTSNIGDRLGAASEMGSNRIASAAGFMSTRASSLHRPLFFFKPATNSTERRLQHQDHRRREARTQSYGRLAHNRARGAAAAAVAAAAAAATGHGSGPEAAIRHHQKTAAAAWGSRRCTTGWPRGTGPS